MMICDCESSLNCDPKNVKSHILPPPDSVWGKELTIFSDNDWLACNNIQVCLFETHVPFPNVNYKTRS